MMIRLLVVICTMTAFVTGAVAQESVLEKLTSDLISAWLVRVDDDSKTRTLKIKGVAQKDTTSFLLDADYGMTDGKQSAVKAEVSQIGPERKLTIVTQADTAIATTQAPDGAFSGTFTTKNGTVKTVSIKKLSAEELLAVQDSMAIAPHVIKQPSNDVPPECARFIGRWKGNWPGYGPTWLWVVEVKPDCVAKCTNTGSDGIPKRFQYCEIKNSILTRNKPEGREEYEVKGDEIWARFIPFTGRVNNAVFEKLQSTAK